MHRHSLQNETLDTPRNDLLNFELKDIIHDTILSMTVSADSSTRQISCPISFDLLARSHFDFHQCGHFPFILRLWLYHLMNFTTLHPKLHLLSRAPQKNMGIASNRTKAVIPAISLNAKTSPALAIHELVVAERPKPMIAIWLLLAC